MNETTLILDIGSGTQDVLYYQPDLALENCPKFVLPSPARMVAQRIAALTEQGRNIYLHGSNMGGGFFRTMKAHQEAGFSVSAHPEAAKALHDRPEMLEKWGIAIEEACPKGYVPLELGDFSAQWWRAYLGMAGLAYPDRVVAAAQDHGVHEDTGNREGRFRIWRTLLQEHNGDPASLLYLSAPKAMTRLATIQHVSGGGAVADSAGAAVLGALFDPEVRAKSYQQGVLVVNVGNSHLVAFLVFQERIFGVYEQHTGMRSHDELLHDLNEFRHGWLTDDEVRNAGGHGCMIMDAPAEAEGFRRTFILGPQRDILKGQGTFLAPGGDMMLAGCFGMLHGLSLLQDRSGC